jgi:hypothetical protein
MDGGTAANYLQNTNSQQAGANFNRREWHCSGGCFRQMS